MLGAEVIRSTQQGTPRIDLKLDGAKIFIAPVAAGDDINPPAQTPYQGLDHFAFFVTDLGRFVDDLKAKGAEFTQDLHVSHPGIRICFLRGSQGVSIELLERDPKIA
ncbi:MAG: VOC family protein [Pseudolabrys sp.]